MSESLAVIDPDADGFDEVVIDPAAVTGDAPTDTDQEDADAV